MRTEFCGRAAEMAVLEASFEKLKGHQGVAAEPQLIVMLGEAGLGKTRIAQEFYRWLSTHHDKVGNEGYWPDELGEIENNLLVNPDPTACNNRAPLPFLWWGIRLVDTGSDGKTVSGALYPYLRFLTPHLEPMYEAQGRKERLKKGGLAVAKAAAGFGTSFIPGAGALPHVIAGADALRELIQLAHEEGAHIIEGADALREVIQLTREDVKDHARRTVAELVAEAEKSLGERLLADFDLLLGRHENTAKAIPVVLYIDDAQFSRSDLGLCAFIGELIKKAWSRKWPLMILCSHWEVTWKEDEARSEPSIARVILDGMQEIGNTWSPLTLAPADDLSPMLRGLFPGLTDVQQEAMLDRAGGNPRYLEEMIRLGLRRPRLFKDHDTDQLLTDDGLAEMLSHSTSLQELIENRLKSAPLAVQKAVSVASLQGVQFVCALAYEVSASLEISGAEDGLNEAEDPHSFVRGVLTGVAEFSQRIYHEVARQALGDVADEGLAETSLRRLLAGLVSATGALSRMSSAEQEATLEVAASLFERSADPTERGVAQKALGQLGYLQLSRFAFLEAAAAYERLLEIQPKTGDAGERHSRIETWDRLVSLYRNQNLEGRAVRALGRVFWESVYSIPDGFDLFLRATDEASAQAFLQTWQSAHADWPAELFLTAVSKISWALLNLSEIVRVYPSLKPSPGDIPVSEGDFVLRIGEGTETMPTHITISRELERRAYAMNGILGDGRVEALHCGVLCELARKSADRDADLASTDELLSRALTLYGHLGDDVGRISVATDLGMLAARREQFDVAEQRLANARVQIDELLGGEVFAVDVVVDEDDGQGGTTNRTIGRTEIPNRFSAEFDEDGMRTMNKVRRLRRIRGNIFGNLGTIAWQRGDLSQARNAYARALEVHEEVGDLETAAQDLVNLFRVARKEGDLKAGCDYLHRCVDLFGALRKRDAQTLGENVWASHIDEVQELIESTGCPK